MTIALAVVCADSTQLRRSYWRSLRESLAISEYAQFLLLNPDSFADERRKVRRISWHYGHEDSNRKRSGCRQSDCSRGEESPASAVSGKLGVTKRHRRKIGAAVSEASSSPNVEVAVKYGLREYVCVLKWNPTSETIDRVSIRRTGSQERLPPATENAVYRKALVDPRIRSRINEALFPSDKALVQSSGEAALDYQVDNTGLWLGFAVFLLIGVAIYVADHYLARLLGVEAADLILALPAFFAIFVVVPVRSLYARYARRKYCATHGHVLWEFDSKDQRHVVMCKRCGAFLQGPSPGNRLRQ